VSEPDNIPVATPKPHKTAKQVWCEWGRPLLIFFVVTSIARSSFGDWNDVPTGSMTPNILAGDRIWVNKVAYDLKIPFTSVHLAKWSEPESGDVVVFYSPKDNTRMVKRVIGRPGDEIALIRNELVVNGKKIEYSPTDTPFDARIPEDWGEYHHYFLEKRNGSTNTIQTTPFVRSRKWFPPVKIPDKHYLMLGDNRDLSADSRSFGLVPRSAIVGQATSVVLSFDREASWTPRWHRFFTPLN
jgi:signal peptidase I